MNSEKTLTLREIYFNMATSFLVVFFGNTLSPKNVGQIRLPKIYITNDRKSSAKLIKGELSQTLPITQGGSYERSNLFDSLNARVACYHWKHTLSWPREQANDDWDGDC